MTIEAIDLDKRYGAHRALRGVSVRVDEGSLVALLGPSGSGKTTLLRVLAGLERPDAGRVLFDGRDVTSGGVGERGVGFVFQHYALFREMTVLENVAFGLRVKRRRERPSDARIRARVEALLALVHLEGMSHRYPSELSGGQRQRVALARALAIEPRVLLLDEPFGALDAKVRRQLRAFLRELHDRVGVTTVLVTHDREEALEVAGRIVLMNHGRIEQHGTPTELHDAPRTAFVESFIGDVNLLDGESDGVDVRVGGLSLPAMGAPPGAVQLVVRAGALAVDAGVAPNATIVRGADLGDRVLLELAIDDGPAVRAYAPRGGSLVRGARVRVSADAYRIYGRGACAAGGTQGTLLGGAAEAPEAHDQRQQRHDREAASET